MKSRSDFFNAATSIFTEASQVFYLVHFFSLISFRSRRQSWSPK